MTVGPEPFNIPGSVLDVQIGTNGGLIGEETQIPIGDIVTIQPLDRLLHRDPVKVLDEKPVGNDPDADALSRKPPQHLRRALHGFQNAKQIALGNGELVQLGVLPWSRIHTPFGQIPRHLRRQAVGINTEPFGGNRPQSFVEISARSVQIDAKNKRGLRHTIAPSLLESFDRMPQSAVFEAVLEFEQQSSASWQNIRAAYGDCVKLHEQLEQRIASESRDDAAIVVSGSVARFELTDGSDIDWTYLVDGQADAKHQEAATAISREIERLGLKDPGREGVFGKMVFSHNLVQYIGGDADTNANLTRRILLLLESKPVGRREAYDRVVRAVLERYLTNDRGWMHGNTPHKVPRFLHNDIARYWRTVTVDFAYKQWTRDNKEWALRSAKLRFSRKLTYAAGLLYCFALAEQFWPEATSPAPDPRRRLEAISTLHGLTNLTPLDLLARGFTQASLEVEGRTCLDAYDEFLGLLRNSNTRNRLADLTSDEADDDETFQRVRMLSRTFQEALTALFIRRVEGSRNPFPLLTEVYGVF
ncbi:MAG TPA: hypothetical protein VGD94_03095 [Vicinamibacterales bacterium]